MAIAEGVAFVGMAGGDGTIGSSAEPLLGADVPLLPVPAGTRNHFSRQLGIIDLEDAARAASGRIESVDVGDVNGHYFVSNSAIGMYPQMVGRRKAFRRQGSPSAPLRSWPTSRNWPEVTAST